MVANPAKANSSPSSISITEGRRSRLRRIAMNSLWSKSRICDISKELALSSSMGLDVSHANEHAVIQKVNE